MDKSTAEKLRKLILNQMCNIANNYLYEGYMCAVRAIEHETRDVPCGSLWSVITDKIFEVTYQEYNKFPTITEDMLDCEYDFDDLINSVTVDIEEKKTA